MLYNCSYSPPPPLYSAFALFHYIWNSKGRGSISIPPPLLDPLMLNELPFHAVLLSRKFTEFTACYEKAAGPCYSDPTFAQSPFEGIYSQIKVNCLSTPGRNPLCVCVWFSFLCSRDRRSVGILFLSCLSFCHHLWNFNFSNYFCSVSARALIYMYHMNISCDMTFGGYHCFLPCHLDLRVWPFFENFNLVKNFWTVSARALIFHKNILCVKTSLLTWPLSLTHFLKTLTLLITFEQWVLELWNFTWVFLVIRPFCWY